MNRQTELRVGNRVAWMDAAVPWFRLDQALSGHLPPRID